MWWGKGGGERSGGEERFRVVLVGRLREGTSGVRRKWRC